MKASALRYIALALLAGSILGSKAASAQRIPQITGWAFSRSSGSGVQNRSAVAVRSDSSGVQTIIETGNVREVQRPGRATAYEIIDPSQEFDSASLSTRTEESSRIQGLNTFSLQDWGYSVFSY